MDVTKSNFKQLLPIIKQVIDDAVFISIDTELTGLHTKFSVNGYDTPKKYYDKVRKTSKDFVILQFGLCAFRYDEDKKTFKNKCYNFYIFSGQSNKNVPDRIFSMQSSSIEFLLEHNFDFNKVFQSGIPYLKKIDEVKWREELQKKQSLRLNRETSPKTINPLPIPKEDKDFVDGTMKIIDDFISNSEVEIILPSCNSFLRRLLYQTAAERYGTKVSLETRIIENKVRRLFVQKLSPEQRAEKETLKCKEESAEIDDAVGFAAVIQYLSESEKLIVGHNMLLDLLHMIDMFMTPLPEDYDEFKECIHCLFPRILDTKFMASSHLFKNHLQSTVLGHIYQSVQEKPFINIPLEYDLDDNYQIDTQQREHEASYDALLTGVVFLSLSQYLGKYQKNNQNTFVWPDSLLVKPFINKLFLMKLQDGTYMTLDGPDDIPSRDHVLHITFPKEWQMQNIVQLFSPFGNVYVAWIDENSAYVALNSPEQAVQALNALSQGETYKVISYVRHQSLIETSLPVKPSPHVTRKRSTSNRDLCKMDEKNKRPKTVLFTESLTKKWRCETIEEEQEVETPENVTTSKTFCEDNTWE